MINYILDLYLIHNITIYAHFIGFVEIVSRVRYVN